MTTEQQLLYYSKIGDDDALKSLLGSSVDLHHRDEQGNTALLLAAEQGHASTVELLLEAGADIYRSNEKGHIPLIVAAMECHTDIVRTILFHSKRVSSRTNPSIVALMAANALEFRGCTEIASLLRAHPG